MHTLYHFFLCTVLLPVLGMLILCGLLSLQIVGKVCTRYLSSIFLSHTILLIAPGLVLPLLLLYHYYHHRRRRRRRHPHHPHFLHHSSVAGSQHSTGLLDQARLIHSYAKNVLTTRHVLSTTASCIRIYCIEQGGD